MNRKPVITVTLIVLNCLFYLFTILCGADFMFSLFGMYKGAVKSNEGFRILTSAFIHMDVIHLVSNMICLWVFGSFLEQNINRFRYIIIYLVSIYVSGWLINICGGNAIHGGASGAIFGLMGAVAVYQKRYKDNTLGNVALCIVINIVYSLFAPGVSLVGHIGGFIGGLITSLIICKKLPLKAGVYKIV